MGNLASSRYLTFIRVGDKDVSTVKPFGLRLPEPVDPSRTPLSVTVEDSDFVMDVKPAQAKLAILKDAPSPGCEMKVAPIPADSYPRFAVAPQVITLTCP